ncbi:MAG: DUF4265 domain-containing protein [Planctomycetota bacterium]|nr:DUF4265 domain-containing protein [Planctomycetota bacterium]
MDAKLTKILFTLGPEALIGGTETMWAEDLGGGRYLLRNSPFYAFGVSFEDIVRGEFSEGFIEFREVLERSGHSTFRLFLLNRRKLDAPDFVQAWARLQALGCSFEQGVVLSVDVPPTTDIEAVWRLLSEGESAGIWEFDEGHCDRRLG